MNTELVGRLSTVQVSSLCDADKSLPVLDAEIRPMVAKARLVGPAVTVVAHDDHLPLLVAVSAAEPGSVLVVATEGHRRAVSGELFATEARRRGLAGIVIDGYCRDIAGLRAVGLPVYARGSTPMAGTTRDAGTIGATVTVGGVPVAAGDLVVGDQDGLVIAAADRLAAALPGALEVERAEAAVLAGLAEGRPLAELTNLAEHLAALRDGRDSALRFTV